MAAPAGARSTASRRATAVATGGGPLRRGRRRLRGRLPLLHRLDAPGGGACGSREKPPRRGWGRRRPRRGRTGRRRADGGGGQPLRQVRAPGAAARRGLEGSLRRSLPHLVELARARPRDWEELATVKGVGPRKLADFGEAVLELVKAEGEGPGPARAPPRSRTGRSRPAEDARASAVQGWESAPRARVWKVIQLLARGAEIHRPLGRGRDARRVRVRALQVVDQRGVGQDVPAGARTDTSTSSTPPRSTGGEPGGTERSSSCSVRR